MFRCGDILRPQVALHALHMFLALFGGKVGSGLETVDLFERGETSHGFGLCVRRVLIAVEVAVASGAEYDIVSIAYGVSGKVGVAPYHDGGVLRKVFVDDLVPAYKLASVLSEETSHMCDEVRLQFVQVVRTEFLHLLLASRAGSPAGFRRLVASDVDVARGEYVHHLLQHMLKEVVGRHASGAEICLFVGFVRTAEFGICRQHLFAVCRHLDFGYDGNAPCCGIVHQFAQFLLCVVSSTGSGLILVHVFPPQGVVDASMVGASVPPRLPRVEGPESCERCQAGIAFDFHAPSGGIRQVEVEAVYLVCRQHVNLFLYELQREEMPTDVEHGSAPGVGRSIVDGAACHATFGVGELLKGLPCPQASKACGGFHLHAVGGYL